MFFHEVYAGQPEDPVADALLSHQSSDQRFFCVPDMLSGFVKDPPCQDTIQTPFGVPAAK